ncbi:uncharacterized protein LOC127001771 [Eriocheir sinensis]|uniref:uncharacterized protein LOC127001771 n=1 Tax=Eriocheir sinensis TaxID=95602 RepID=UPI0021C65F10|nr:uncharacterized protein LOC127001771 [Eriocheir sinensis]
MDLAEDRAREQGLQPIKQITPRPSRRDKERQRDREKVQVVTSRSSSSQVVMAAEAPLKPLQLQVARIRQEEEDSWISGEELYTEGSSDDEGAAHAHAPTHAHPHPHFKLPASPAPRVPGKLIPPKSPVEPPPSTTPSAASEPAEQTDPHLTETTRRLSLMGLENAEKPTTPTPTPKDAEEVEEQEEVMLWRPKRGSIKLPHIDLDPPAPSLLEQVSG